MYAVSLMSRIPLPLMYTALPLPLVLKSVHPLISTPAPIPHDVSALVVPKTAIPPPLLAVQFFITVLVSTQHDQLSMCFCSKLLRPFLCQHLVDCLDIR